MKVNGATVECDYLVIATHVPLLCLSGLINATLFQTKLAPYSSYAIGARLPSGEFPEASFWDTSDPYYYLRIDRRGRNHYAIFGGEDHKTGQESNTQERLESLQQKLVELIPGAKVDCQWSGQVIESNDGLPYIGETAPGQFAATGFGGNGMTFGTLAGLMACDAALGRENPWHDLFTVDRKKLRGGTWQWVKENLDYPYYLIGDSLTKPDAKSVSEVGRGEGKVLRIDGKWVACSRNEAGKMEAVSAVCTHMGCLVHWNQAEKTWDCPCHGSRFQPTGKVLAGPAETALAGVSVTQEQPAEPAENEKQPRKRSKAAANARRRVELGRRA